MTGETRPGETVLPFDPGLADDARLAFIGRLHSPWQRGDCPKNLTEARARGGRFGLTLDPAYRPGLEGIRAGDALIVLYWMQAAARDLIVQAPRHRPSATGVFALRSPARPNPVALAVVRVLALDPGAGWVQVDALDAFDNTPLLDIKPWLPGVDLPQAAP